MKKHLIILLAVLCTISYLTIVNFAEEKTKKEYILINKDQPTIEKLLDKYSYKNKELFFGIFHLDKNNKILRSFVHTKNIKVIKDVPMNEKEYIVYSKRVDDKIEKAEFHIHK